MKANQSSRTAQVMALFRALETAGPTSARMLNDSFAITVLPSFYKALVLGSKVKRLRRAIGAAIDRRWPGARTSGIARTRLLDDWVCGAVKGGASQVVILGAGFDSRAWRLPTLAATPVYEVDHPATSAEKLRFLKARGLNLSMVQQVSADFDIDNLASALKLHGFDTCKRTIVLWEGVTQYLTAAAVDAVLSWVASLAPGSVLAFTYLNEAVLRNPTSFEGAERILASIGKTGEPWIFGIDPAQLAGHLRLAGLTLSADLGADDYRPLYYNTVPAIWGGYAFYRAALATVTVRAEV